MKNVALTQEMLKQHLSYNPETGVFTRHSTGEKAGHLHKGYVRIHVCGKQYKAHRLAWLYVHGVWPEKDIDHRDRVKTHNWIKNLREATNVENHQNVVLKAGKTGVVGAYYTNDPTKKPFGSGIRINGKRIHLGYFDTAEEAGAAYQTAKEKHHAFRPEVA